MRININCSLCNRGVQVGLITFGEGAEQDIWLTCYCDPCDREITLSVKEWLNNLFNEEAEA